MTNVIIEEVLMLKNLCKWGAPLVLYSEEEKTRNSGEDAIKMDSCLGNVSMFIIN